MEGDPDGQSYNPAGRNHVRHLQYYFEQSARFFLLLALVQAWIVGLDTIFSSFGVTTWLTILTGLLFVVLMISKNYRVHVGGLVVVGLTFIFRTILLSV